MTPEKLLDLMDKEISRVAYIDKLRPGGKQHNKEPLRVDKLRILISIMLSARTKDELTEEVAERLFSKYSSTDLCGLNEKKIESLIYPVGFYRTKAKHIKQLCRVIKEKYGWKVPDKLDALLNLPGVGRKTANLFLSTAYNKNAICVDIHVHRISKRLGLVKTKTPFETEMALAKIFPEKLWSKINSIFVPFGKEVCKPIKPKCDICPLKSYCNFYRKKNMRVSRKVKKHSTNIL